MYKTNLTSLNKNNVKVTNPSRLPQSSSNVKPQPPNGQQTQFSQIAQSIRGGNPNPVNTRPQSGLQQQPIPQQRPVQPAPPSRQQQARQPLEAVKVEPLFECPEGCGRSFNQVALPKHAKVCKKVFQQKRKEFNSAKQRIIEDETQLQVTKKTTLKGGKGQTMTRPTTATTRPATNNQSIKVQKMSKPQPQKANWRAQSEAFRAVVKSQKGVPMTKEQQQMVSQAMTSNLVPCKFCGRKFNETAAAKHIPVCEKKAKENKIKMGGPAAATSKPQAPGPVPVKSQPQPQVTQSRQVQQPRLMSGNQRNKPY